MKIFRGDRAAAVLLLAAAFTACDESPTAPDSTPPAAAAARVLVVTHTTGFRHSSIGVAEPIIMQIARTSGAFDVSYCRTSDDVRRMLSADALRAVDAVVFANTTGDLGIPDLEAFLGWIASGRGFVGVHSAADTYNGAASYHRMLGNDFDGHGDQTEVEAVVESPAHPAVSHFGARYRVFDEIYRFVRNNRADVTPLLTLDRYPRDGLPRAGEPGDLPLAWSKSHGSGRVFYTALGHREEVWQDARFQQHVLGGIRSVLGR